MTVYMIRRKDGTYYQFVNWWTDFDRGHVFSSIHAAEKVFHRELSRKDRLASEVIPYELVPAQ